MFFVCASVLKGWAQDFCTVNIGSTHYATLYVDQPLSFESFGDNLKAYAVVGMKNGIATMARIKKIPAKKAVVLKAISPGEYNIPIEPCNVVFSSLMRGVLTRTFLDPVVTINGKEYTNMVLGNVDGRVAFYRVSPDGGYLDANKGYLQVPSTSVPASSDVVDMAFDEEEVDLIEDVEAAPSFDNRWFTIQGVSVPHPIAKGIYIHQGKKVVVK